MKGECCIYDKRIFCQESSGCVNCMIYLNYIRKENKEKRLM
jgi:hypothetical protein